MSIEKKDSTQEPLDVEDDPKVIKLIRGQADFVKESLEAAKLWIDTQPIEKLKQIIKEGNWIMGPTGEEDGFSDAELRNYMKDLLFEDKSFVAIALTKNKIPFEIEEYEEE
jgi:hypothetical protein